MSHIILSIYSIYSNWMLGSQVLIIKLLLSVTIIFFQRRDPKSVWAWLLAVNFLPITGIILYILIGQNYNKARMFKLKEAGDKINSVIRTQEETIRTNTFEMLNDSYTEYKDLIMYNLEASNSIYTDDNKITIYTDGEDKFSNLIKEIEKAQSYIHIQYYIIRDDELFARIEEPLIRKAKEGVEVRILYDSMGCRDFKRKRWNRLRAEGIMIGEFFPALFRRLQLRINYRNHRKIVVIDGRCGFVGGFNVGREYLGLNKKKFGYWRDTHMKIEGSAVESLQIRFILDWNYTTKQNLFKDEKYLSAQYRTVTGNTGVQIVASGPDSAKQNVRNNYLRLISKAKKSICIQTPYFIPDEAILEAIKIASLSGIDVKIMIPCKPDHPFVYWATYAYIGELLDYGVKCYTYNNGFLHAKGVVVDSMVSCYGTANMDIRSFKLNFEVNAVIYSRDIASQFEEIFTQDLKKCTQITKYNYNKRKLIIRIKEQISRLLSPLM